MGLRVDARDVLDTNGLIKATFHGEVSGHFRRTGPNSWDDFELVRRDGGVIEVLAGIRVQVEEAGVEFRMRSRGKVLTVRWQPTQEEAQRLAQASASEVRAAFLDGYVQPFGEAPGMGAAAVIAKKLQGDD